MNRIFILGLCGVLSLQMAYGQEQRSVRELADEAYAVKEYARAANLYDNLAAKEKNLSIDLMGKLANCYREMNQIPAATHWYEMMLRRPECPDSIRLIFVEILKRNEDYKRAKEELALFHPAKADGILLKDKLLAGCDSAVAWKSLTPDFSLETMKDLCTENDEWISGVTRQGLLIEANGYRKMRINGAGESRPKIDNRLNQPYFKSYMLKQYTAGSANNVLEEVLPKLLGKFSHNIGPVCFNNREDTAYITMNLPSRPNEKNELKQMWLLWLFRSVKQGDKWSWLDSVSMRELNVQGYSSSHAVLNREGNILYFISDRPGGYGKADIWYSEKKSGGRWGTPKNCGPVINTPMEESCPTINENGYLYFSSKGHAGMGGYDIYRAQGSRSEWQEPQNLRSPVNSGGDDLGFILKGNSYEGYFSSNRIGGMGGDDVYHFMDAHFTEKLKKPDTTVQQVAVVEPDRPVPDKPVEPVVAAVKPPVAAPVPDNDQPAIDKLEQLKFLYDYNSAVLLDESKRVLDNVAVVLSMKPYWKLIIRSYADNRGSDTYNLDLTAQRCYAVITYLAKKGIAPKRFFYQNMGEKDPINLCGEAMPCTEAQHQENRRTELTVVK